MEVLSLLLVFFTVSGYAYVVQPRLTVSPVSRLDGRHQSELRDVLVSLEEKISERPEEEQRSGGVTPETNSEAPGTFSETLRGETKTANMRTDLVPDEETETVKTAIRSHNERVEEKVAEERESGLVAGIRGDVFTVNQENVSEKEGNEKVERTEEEERIKNANQSELVGREEEDHMVVSDLTPPSTSSPPLGEELVIQIITQSPNPPGSPPPLHHHNVSSSLPPSPDATLSPHFFPPSVTVSDPTTIRHSSVSTWLPAEVRSVSLLEDLLTEVLQSPGHLLKQNELQVKASPDVEAVMVENILFKPARQQSKGAEFIPKLQEATPEHQKFITKDLKEPDPTPKSNETPNMTQPTVQLVENDTKVTKKKDNKTKKPKKKKEVSKPTYFPYFKDNYCPPECACYGRVVQCSDKGVDNVPYGIPYNARYILLMNNHIKSIQLDLLNEYVSMEFLVLSNNRLTDGAIEGAFEGVPALKRLYLDRNLLDSVPTDLPVSLEELRLDNNRLGVMSEAAWARCPGLLVLSLSNNSLGNGSESLPNAVLSPLCNLRTLNLDHNQLTSVPLGLPLSVKELYLKGNLIEQFRGGAFEGRSELLVLDLSANRLTNKGLLRESLLNATRLESLNLEGNRLTQVPRHLPRSLKTLNLEGNLISSIKRAGFGSLKNLEHLGLARNKIFKVAPGAFKTLPVLHQLDLSHNTLLQVPRQLPEALHSVALTHNKIQSVPRDAFCWGNKSVGLSGLVRVQLEHNLIDMGKLDAQAFRCLRGFQVVHFY
ncbi:wu:fc23c09 [Centropristis striata]|uniref:wu:fc23c09 n=1 Tax=Centropristis striata TaxID=184440 RepID=UPI0027DEB03D|nr:wu:fc23c09 [Centropristis striata]